MRNFFYHEVHEEHEGLRDADREARRWTLIYFLGDEKPLRAGGGGWFGFEGLCATL